MRSPDLLRRLPISPQLLTFLVVGGSGYVVDVVVFNLLRSTATLGAWDPSVARILAVAAAMVVTYLGNSLLTWRGEGDGNRRREVSLFVAFNLIGLGLSVLTLTISHDVLGLTSRLADNISANVVGLALGTLFRYWSYKTFVFAGTGTGGTGGNRGSRARTHLADGGHTGTVQGRRLPSLATPLSGRSEPCSDVSTALRPR
jgi:putative flippase GtrA